MVSAKGGTFAVVAALILTGCGGGGSAPNTPKQSTPAQTSSSKTVVGTAKLTLALPKVITATRNGKAVAVRAVPKGAQRALPRGTARSPRFVDPSPNPGYGPCTGGSAGDNYLDIYVVSYGSATLLTDLDNQGEVDDSLCVQQTSDSTQSVNIPLYSTEQNEIVAVEWDATGDYVLAIGEADYGSFSPGYTISATLTMQMNAYSVGITDLGFEDPTLMYGGSFAGVGASCPGNSQVAIYETDGVGNFIPAAGSGGTATPSMTGTADSGTTTLSQTTIPGVYNVAWDGSCDSITVNATGQNPAYPIYTDAVNYSGVYPGIDFLYNNDYNNFQNWFGNQLDYNPDTGSIDILNNDDL